MRARLNVLGQAGHQKCNKTVDHKGVLGGDHKSGPISRGGGGGGLEEGERACLGMFGKLDTAHPNSDLKLLTTDMKTVKKKFTGWPKSNRQKQHLFSRAPRYTINT